jgi:uncharacterized membrane protein YfcA
MRDRLARHNVPIHHAVGTSAALGLPIAVAGATGFVLAGLRHTDLPRWSAGYVYLPAMAVIVVASVLVAPFGAYPRGLHTTRVPLTT